MSWVKVTRILDRDAAIEGLTRMRQEWQDAANGAPLNGVQTSVGLLLLDVVNAIGLLPEEAALVMGEGALFVELEPACTPELMRISF